MEDKTISAKLERKDAKKEVGKDAEEELRNILSLQAICKSLYRRKSQQEMQDILKIDRRTVNDILNYNHQKDILELEYEGSLRSSTLHKSIIEAKSNDEVNVVDFTNAESSNPIICNSRSIKDCFNFFKSYKKINWLNCSKKFNKGLPESAESKLRDLHDIVIKVKEPGELLQNDYSFENLLDPKITLHQKFLDILGKLESDGIQLRAAKACESIHLNQINFPRYFKDEDKYFQKAKSETSKVTQNEIWTVNYKSTQTEELVNFPILKQQILCDPIIYIGLFDINKNTESVEHIFFNLKTPVINTCSRIFELQVEDDDRDESYEEIHGIFTSVIHGDIYREDLEKNYKDVNKYIIQLTNSQKASQRLNPLSLEKGIEEYKYPIAGGSQEKIDSKNIKNCTITSVEYYFLRETVFSGNDNEY